MQHYARLSSNTKCALRGGRGAGRLLPSPSELRHKHNMRSARRTRCRSTATLPFRATPQIQCALCKEDEVQVDCYPLLPSYATSIMCSPQGGRGTGRLLLLLPSYATSIMCTPQGRRGAGRLMPSSSEKHRKNPTEGKPPTRELSGSPALA